jgi:hypothetical protein
VSFTEDFAPFFADFADAGLLDGQPVQGIYDAPYTVGLQGGPGMAGELPQYTLPTASVPAEWENKSLVITQGKGAGSYLVRGHTPDGTGVSFLALEISS